MACRSYRDILRSHGLKLMYEDSKKASFAWKSYKDESGKEALILVERKRGAFSVKAFGKGSWRKYFSREAAVLKKLLAESGYQVSKR